MNNKELDIFMDDYFSDHHPISKENARKRIQSLLKQAELRGSRSELKKLMNYTADNTLDLDDEYLISRFKALEAELEKLG